MFENIMNGLGSVLTWLSYGSVYEVPTGETFVLTRAFALELLDNGEDYRYVRPLVGRQVRFEDGTFAGKPYRFLGLAAEKGTPN